MHAVADTLHQDTAWTGARGDPSGARRHFAFVPSRGAATPAKSRRDLDKRATQVHQRTSRGTAAPRRAGTEHRASGSARARAEEGHGVVTVQSWSSSEQPKVAGRSPGGRGPPGAPVAVRSSPSSRSRRSVGAGPRAQAPRLRVEPVSPSASRRQGGSSRTGRRPAVGPVGRIGVDQSMRAGRGIWWRGTSSLPPSRGQVEAVEIATPSTCR